MTLTQTAQFTKRALRGIIILGSAFLLLWITFLYIYNNIYLPQVKANTKPEMRFGTLPPPLLPPSLVSSNSLTYNLDTESGFLPTGFPRLVNIYFVPPQTISLLAPDKAQKLAVALGFNATPDIVSPTKYNFNDGSGGTLTIDLNSGNFKFEKKLAANTDSSSAEFATADQIASNFKSFLDGKDLLNPALKSGPTKVTYDKGSPLESDTAIVSLWPSSIDKLPIVSENPIVGPISATLNKTSADQEYTNLTYTYWPVDQTTYSTYQIMPITQSFTELKKGYGSIIQKPDNTTTISITNVFLAYFIPTKYAAYLQPVYVYQGDHFTAYIPALIPSSYSSGQ